MLIEKGKLVGYMHDRLSAKHFELAPERQRPARELRVRADAAHDEHDPARRARTIRRRSCKSVKRGVFAKKFGGGQVDIANGDFVFSLTESYLVEDGKITAPLKGVNLIGNGPDVLRKVTMLGNDVEVSDGIWTCGKDGQSVPVGVGCPTIKICVDHGRRHEGRLTGGRARDASRDARRESGDPDCDARICALIDARRVSWARLAPSSRGRPSRQLESPEGAAAMLRQLGAEVRTLDLWDDFVERRRTQARADGGVRAMVFEAGERPDLAVAALRAARKVRELAETPTHRRAAAAADHALRSGERLRRLHRRCRACRRSSTRASARSSGSASEFATEERLKIGAHRGRPRRARGQRRRAARRRSRRRSSRCSRSSRPNRGRVFSRETLLARVWGSRYEGGARTVDIHVRRLRAKLGDALPLETLRGAGYKLRARRATERAKRMTRAARIAVSIGCPCGVGPEVSVVAAARGATARARPARRRRGRAAGGGRGREDRASAHRARRRSPDEAWSARARAHRRLAADARRSRRATARPGAPTRAVGRRAARVDRRGVRPRGAAAARTRSSTGPGEQGGDRALAARRARAAFLGHTEHLQRRLARARGGDGVLVAGARRRRS